MKQHYAEWMAANITPELAFAKCVEWTTQMHEVFPELKRVRGHVMLSTGVERTHWWLVDGEEIVDPTASQFSLPYFQAKPLFYTPWDETQPEPTGTCPNCSGMCYNGDCCCSDRCAKAYAAYCMNPD